jgi:hypothetical protein
VMCFVLDTLMTDVLFWSISLELLQLLVITIASSTLAIWQWIKVMGLQVISLICEIMC